MKGFIGALIVWASIACAGIASAAPEKAVPAPKSAPAPAPKPTAAPAPKPATAPAPKAVPAPVPASKTAPARKVRPVPRVAPAPNVAPEQLERATQLYNDGQLKQALDVINQGLALAPEDRSLLKLKGGVLLKLNDLVGALDAYEVFIKVSPQDAPRFEAEKIVKILKQRMTTFLEVTVANGPTVGSPAGAAQGADVYVGFMTRGAFCRAAPSCKGALSPGDHKVTVVRSGFRPFEQRVSVKSGETAQVAVTLTEDPSLLTVRVAQPGAQITVDGSAYALPTKVDPGPHQIVVSLAGHAPERIDAVAKEGKPIDLDVVLKSIVPIHVEPPGATVELDGKPAELRDGGVAIAPGAHALLVRAPGYADGRREIPAERGSDYKIDVTLQRAELASRGPLRGLSFRRKLALAAGGTGLVAGGIGAVLGLWSKQLDADARALCPSPSVCPSAPSANALSQRAHTRALEANIAYGVAGGAALAAALLWLTGAPESRVAVTPRLGAVAGLALSGRF